MVCDKLYIVDLAEINELEVCFFFRLLVYGVVFMNILFEIADKDLMIIGGLLVAILIVAFIIFKVALNGTKVKPISEDERYDSDDNLDEIKVEEVSEPDDSQKKAREELENLYRQMSADLEKQEEKHDNAYEFEKEQEESAIISYQELMAQAEKLKKQADKYESSLEDNADMKVHDAMHTYKKYSENVKEASENSTYHGFKNSDIISPIYGIQKDNKKSSSKVQNNGIINGAYEEADSYNENEKNVDFLNSLKEFRKNL